MTIVFAIILGLVFVLICVGARFGSDWACIQARIREARTDGRTSAYYFFRDRPADETVASLCDRLQSKGYRVEVGCGPKIGRLVLLISWN
jgi:hypothetical protein